MKSVSIGLSVAIVAYTETMKRIENEQESELKKTNNLRVPFMR